MKATREHLSGWPSWLLASDDEGSETCAIVSGRGAVIGIITLDGREAWVRGKHVQPRRPGPGNWATRVKSYKQETITLPSRTSVLSGQVVTIIRRAWNGPLAILTHADDTDPEIVTLPSPLGEVIDINAGVTRFEDWGSV